MSETKPIPVRLDHDLIERLDQAAERLGNTRTGVIKLCLTAFLDHFEATGTASLPLNWKDILDFWDRRTRRSRGEEPRPSKFPELKDTPHIMNEPTDAGVEIKETPAGAQPPPATEGQGRKAKRRGKG